MTSNDKELLLAVSEILKESSSLIENVFCCNEEYKNIKVPGGIFGIPNRRLLDRLEFILSELKGLIQDCEFDPEVDKQDFNFVP